jgi:hypothetical protein
VKDVSYPRREQNEDAITEELALRYLTGISTRNPSTDIISLFKRQF